MTNVDPILHVEGQDLALEWECDFIETSTKSGKNVKQAFYDIVREIRRYTSIRK
jgi:GTPase KRas protein